MENQNKTNNQQTMTNKNLLNLRNNYKEVELERDLTSTYRIDTPNMECHVLLTYFQIFNVIEHVSCIQRLLYAESTDFEVTFKSVEVKKKVMHLYIITKPTFENKTITLVDNRKLMTIERIPTTRVMIYEAPYELENSAILNKIMQYGLLQEHEIIQHVFHGTEIHNGIRSVFFKAINKPIPTTIFVKGNKIKLKHEGQDRTPVCSLCHQRGHYKDNCPNSMLEQLRDETEDEINPQYITGEEIIEEQNIESSTNESVIETQIENKKENEGQQSWSQVVSNKPKKPNKVHKPKSMVTLKKKDDKNDKDEIEEIRKKKKQERKEKKETEKQKKRIFTQENENLKLTDSENEQNLDDTDINETPFTQL